MSDEIDRTVYRRPSSPPPFPQPIVDSFRALGRLTHAALEKPGLRLLPGIGRQPLHDGPPDGLPDVLGCIGSLEVRLARTTQDLRRAQRLRFKVFYEEMSAAPNAASFFLRRDADKYDMVCDHLLVIDRKVDRVAGRIGRPKVVGTYRLLRQDVAERNFGFYTQHEFDIAPILRANPTMRFLELGRSCVLEAYRDKRTVELLWHGIWKYVLHHRIDAMLGCASLEGTDPDAIAAQLSFLHHSGKGASPWTARALPHRYVPMNRIPAERLDSRDALKSLPPLIKGYLRLGATFGDGAVIDRQFGTTDVLVMLPVSAIGSRYVNYYGSDAQRHAA